MSLRGGVVLLVTAILVAVMIPTNPKRTTNPLRYSHRGQPVWLTWLAALGTLALVVWWATRGS